MPSSPVSFHFTRLPRPGMPFHGSMERTVPIGSFGLGIFFFFLFGVSDFVPSSVPFGVCLPTSAGFSGGVGLSRFSETGSTASMCVSGDSSTFFFSSSLFVFSSSYLSFPSAFPYCDSSQSRPLITTHPSRNIGGPSPPSIRVRTADRVGVFQSTAKRSTVPVQISQPRSLEIQLSSTSQSDFSFSSPSGNGRGVAASTAMLFHVDMKVDGKSAALMARVTLQRSSTIA
mmetsp:Transcript_23754/g.41728  ORF Transcript_23754/g.41728 Transcript_23754/m.41728 type:complete len:229 (-) Transcript_23754:290-976(-)